MRALVVGAGGYLGAWAAQQLGSAGHSVIAHARSDTDSLGPEKILGDVREPATIRDVCEAEPEALVYTVSLDHRSSEGPVDDVMRVNVHPLLAILRELGGRHLRRLIYLSTVQVYGRQTGAITEATPPQPANAYGLTHLMCEQVGSLFQERAGTDVYNLRIGNSFGRPLRPNTNCWTLVVNELCKMAMQDGAIRLQSDGSPERDFLHVSDVASAIALCASDKPPVSGTYNVVSGKTRTILDVAHCVVDVAKTLGVDVSILGPDGQSLLKSNRDDYRPATLFSAESLNRHGWRCQMSVTDAIKDLLSHV